MDKMIINGLTEIKKDKDGNVLISQNDDCIILATPEAKITADAIYKLLGISIDDLQRQAFEAGREKDGKITTWDVSFGNTNVFKYPTYTDYTNSLTDKNGDNG